MPSEVSESFIQLTEYWRTQRREGEGDKPRSLNVLRKRVVLTCHLTLSLTDEAIAAVNVQALHAFRVDECTDITSEAPAAAEGQVLHACGEDERTMSPAGEGRR